MFYCSVRRSVIPVVKYAIITPMQHTILSVDSMKELGAKIGQVVRGGEVLELVGDVGAGKTTFTKGLASAMGIDEDVQSPTFTISRVYQAADQLLLAHYDFYRLDDPGIMRAELEESVNDPLTITVIEWAEVVADVLPADTLRIIFGLSSLDENIRTVELVAGGSKSKALVEQLV